MVIYVCDLYVFLIFSNMSNVNAWVVCMHKCFTNIDKRTYPRLKGDLGSLEMIILYFVLRT